ncbi:MULTISPECIES: 3-hydroxyacyl-CoA dehydrogenase family protein [Xanthobacter]|uniref:3-hydroxyacyl-CoA dehydrogenase family protein n=1 Tax=Xanthobacter aminoxidans TaxID=186280 RepID=A0ABW6ZNJ7_9HYPH|nr:3-hydroxyacyl-CoA dehydrogenase family protein [Xanthobacter sp. 91]
MPDLSYSIARTGESRAFPGAHAFIDGATAEGAVLVLLGPATAARCSAPERTAVLVELGTECLAAYEREEDPPASSNLVGFARWRLGANPPSDLIELVAGRTTRPDALDAAQAVFEAAGFTVSRCADRAGRIVDRLLRPQFNLALTALDDGLATAEDMDLCLKLGLGYRQGLLAPLLGSGLADHYDVTRALFEVYGQAQYAPPRLAVVARQKADKAEPSHASLLREAGE